MSLTCFKGLVKYTQAPGALPSAFDHLHRELVLRVGLKVVNMDVEVCRVDVFGLPGFAGIVFDGVVPVVCDALGSPQCGVRPRDNDGCRGQHDGL